MPHTLLNTYFQLELHKNCLKICNISFKIMQFWAKMVPYLYHAHMSTVTTPPTTSSKIEIFYYVGGFNIRTL